MEINITCDQIPPGLSPFIRCPRIIIKEEIIDIARTIRTMKGEGGTPKIVRTISGNPSSGLHLLKSNANILINAKNSTPQRSHLNFLFKLFIFL